MDENPTNDLQASGLVSHVGQWFKHPFNAQGSVLNWALFLGMIIIVSFLWNVILIKYIDLPELAGVSA